MNVQGSSKSHTYAALSKFLKKNKLIGKRIKSQMCNNKPITLTQK